MHAPPAIIAHSEGSLGKLPFRRFLGFLVFIVNRNRLEIFGLVDLVAIKTPDIVDTITPGQDFGTAMLTGLHMESQKRLPLF
jgi:hypothetical protein